MPVAVKLKTPGAGATNRSVIDLTLDYPNATALPDLIMLDRKLWERTGGAASTNYRPYAHPIFVEVDAKIIEV